MLVMAYLGQALTDAVTPSRIRSFSTRFAAITQLGAQADLRGHGRRAAGARWREAGAAGADHQGSDRRDQARRRSNHCVVGRGSQMSETEGKSRARHRLGPRHRPRHRAQAGERRREGRRQRSRRSTGARRSPTKSRRRAAQAVAVNGSVTDAGFADRFVGAALSNVRWARHHRQQRRLHLGHHHPEDDRRAVPGDARRASRGALPHPARRGRADPRSWPRRKPTPGARCSARSSTSPPSPASTAMPGRRAIPPPRPRWSG